MDTAALNLKITTEGMEKAQRGLEGLVDIGRTAESVFKGLGAAMAAKMAAQMAQDAAMLTARYDTLGVSMNMVGRNAGYTARAMADYQQALQKTGISALESRNTLTMMAGAQIDLANSSRLARIAQDAAVIGNINSSEAFQRMIYGIQSGQVEILRTIGINVNFEQSYKALAKQLGKTAQDLTEQEKAQARVNAVMEKGKDLAGTYEAAMGTVGKQLKSMERYAQDLQLKIGELFQPSMNVMVEEWTKRLKDSNEFMSQNADSTSRMAEAMAEVVRQGDGFFATIERLTFGTKGKLPEVGAKALGGAGGLMALGRDWLSLTSGNWPGMLRDALDGKDTNLSDWIKRTYGPPDMSGYLNAADMAGGLDPGMNIYGFWGRETAKRAQQAKELAAWAASQQAAVRSYGASDDLSLLGSDYNGMSTVSRDGMPEIQSWSAAAYEYEKAIKTLDKDLDRFAKNNRTTWNIVSEVVQDSSRTATDELVRWMDNLDGVGRSWKTLGDTVKAVLRDMIIQMQRAIVQQQLMDPLLKAFVGWAPSLFGGATKSPTTGGTAGGGLNYEDLIANPGGGAERPSIVVNVSSSGQVDGQVAGKGAADLWGAIEPALNSWAIKQSRQGGLLAAR